MKPKRPPLMHKLTKRAETTPERVNALYRGRHPANRTGWLDLAIGGALVVILLGSFWFLKGVR